MGINLEEIKDFYNNAPEIWAKNDKWHQWSLKQINEYLSQIPISSNDVVLNAGAGGNDYGIEDITPNIFNVDIAENKIKGMKNAIVCSVEKIPLASNMFSRIICVGSVINYCDATAVISEFSRLLSTGGILVLEFESSCGYEYKNSKVYNQSAETVTVRFQGQNHHQWLFSPRYILSLLKGHSFSISEIYPYHITSSLALHYLHDEDRSVRFAKYDNIAKYIPWCRKHANNFIIKCTKL